jgi:hypothetical protein
MDWRHFYDQAWAFNYWNLGRLSVMAGGHVRGRPDEVCERNTGRCENHVFATMKVPRDTCREWLHPDQVIGMGKMTLSEQYNEIILGMCNQIAKEEENAKGRIVRAIDGVCFEN